MDSLVMKDLHPRKRWKSRILHQKCILITCHSWTRGLLARHYMFKTTQKFQRVNQQWPYQVQWMFNSQYMACGYVNSPLQWHQHHPESPPELPWNRFRQQFGCKIHRCPSQKLGLLWDPWPLFSVALRNSKAHLFKKNTNLQKLKKLRKKEMRSQPRIFVFRRSRSRWVRSRERTARPP